MKRSLIIIYSFLLISLFIPKAFAEKVLSDELPKELVRQIINEGLWENKFDDNNTAEAKDLSWFWQQIDGGGQDVSAIIDQLFAIHGGSSGASIRLPKMYPIKILFLRYQRSNKNSAYVQQITQAWMKRYLDMAFVAIEMANIPDIKQIADNFRNRLANKEIVVNDLSPAERARIQAEIPQSHGVDISSRDTSTGKYIVTGLYNEDKLYFGLDFARPLEDTLITFAHEMVHAADPQLVRYREQYKKLFDPAMNILSSWLTGKNGPNKELAFDIVEHLFFEMGLQHFKETADLLRKKRMEQLKQSLNEKNENTFVFEPKPEDLKLVKDWIGAAVGLTIQNEYRAYGYSILLYAVLKSRFQILPQNKEKQEYVEKLLAGDDVIATQLAVSMNPFRNARSVLFYQFMQPATRQSNDTDAKLSYLRIGKVLDQLELLYLDEVQALLFTLNNKISDYLKHISIDALREPNILPEWSRPGGFDLPSNPFLILTARITTAWVLRFQQNIELFIQDLKNMNAPLNTLQNGILDLHDLNRGERKLVGVSYENSPWANDPTELDEKLKQDLDTIPIDVSKYFEVVKWAPETAVNGDVIDGQIVAQNLIRLRTLKASVWLDQAFPVMNNTVLGVKSFLQRLREKLFNPDELSPERVRELEQELVTTWQQANLGVDELVRLRTLVQELSMLYQIAVDSKWVTIATTLNEKIRFVLQALDLMGVSGSEVERTIITNQQKDRADFLAKLFPYIENCKKVSSSDIYRLGGFWPERGPFQLGDAQFALTMVCYHSNLYLVRQPGDYLNYMTTLIRDSAPESRIFIGSRPVRLFPMRIENDAPGTNISKSEKKSDQSNRSKFLNPKENF